VSGAATLPYRPFLRRHAAWCGAARACRAHQAPDPLDEIVYFASLSNAAGRAALFAGMTSRSRIFSFKN
jgi:hypothetical protein